MLSTSFARSVADATAAISSVGLQIRKLADARRVPGSTSRYAQVAATIASTADGTRYLMASAVASASVGYV
jgi:hypothetical protein